MPQLGEAALACKAPQLLVGWHLLGLQPGTSEPSKAAENPAPGLWLWDQKCRNITTQDTDLWDQILVWSPLCWCYTGISIWLQMA